MPSTEYQTAPEIHPGRLVPAINSKSGSCAAAVPRRLKTLEQRHASCNYKKPVFQILCVTGRMTLLCSFCTCPSKTAATQSVFHFPVFSTFHPKSIPLSTISTDFAVFQASSNEGKMHLRNRQQKQNQNPAHNPRIECFRQPSSFLYFTADTKPGRREQKQSAELLRYTRCQIRGGKAPPFCEAVFRRGKADNTDTSLPEGVSQPFHHAFQAAVKPAKAHEINAPHRQQPISNENPCHTGQGRPMRRTPRAARTPGRAERARSGVPSGAVKFCHFPKTCVTLPFPVFLPAPQLFCFSAAALSDRALQRPARSRI